MNPQQQQNQALKRMYKDLKDLEQEPIKGIGICIPNSQNPRTLRVNIEIQDGPYEGTIVPHYMRILETFPSKPPQMIIDIGFPQIHPLMMSYSSFFKMEDEAQIDTKNANSYCLDILETHAFQQIKKAGWSSAYTIKTLLIQIQAMLGDSSMYYNQNSDDNKKKQAREFKTTIKVEGKNIEHCQNNPFPKISNGISQIKDNKKEENSNKMPQDVVEKLTCYLTRDSILDDENIIFGYPIKSVLDKFKRIQMEAFGEVLSLQGLKETEKLSQEKRKTAQGENFNGWIPLYINEKHFQRASQYINGIGKYLHGQGVGNYKDFITIIPKLLNKMVVSMFNSEGQIGIAQIEMYCQFQRLFRRLIQENSELRNEINRIVVQKTAKNDQVRNKKLLPDIGEFIALVGFSDYNLTDVLPIVYKEYYARQIFWIFKGQDSVKFKSTTEMLSFAYAQAGVSNNILLFNVGVQKYLGSEEFQKSLEERNSFIKQDDAEKFLNELKGNAKNIKKHSFLWNYVDLKPFYPVNDIVQYELDWFQTAVNLSNSQGYTKNTNIQNKVQGQNIQNIIRNTEIFDKFYNRKLVKKQDQVNVKVQEQEKIQPTIQQNNDQKEQNNSIISPDLSNLEQIFKNLNSPCDIFVQIPNNKENKLQEINEFTNFLQSQNEKIKNQFSIEKFTKQQQVIFKILVKPPRQNALEIVKILLENLYMPKLVQKSEKFENLNIINENIDFINDLVSVQKDEQSLSQQFKDLNKKHDVFLFYSDNFKNIQQVEKIINSQQINKINVIENLGYIIDIKPPRENAKQICLNLIREGHLPILKPNQN